MRLVPPRRVLRHVNRPYVACPSSNFTLLSCRNAPRYCQLSLSRPDFSSPSVCNSPTAHRLHLGSRVCVVDRFHFFEIIIPTFLLHCFMVLASSPFPAVQAERLCVSHTLSSISISPVEARRYTEYLCEYAGHPIYPPSCTTRATSYHARSDEVDPWPAAAADRAPPVVIGRLAMCLPYHSPNLSLFWPPPPRRARLSSNIHPSPPREQEES